MKLLDIDDDKEYCYGPYDGTVKSNPVGKKKKVAYRKTMFGYDIRGLEERGQSGLKIMFVMQLIPFLIFIGISLVLLF